MMKMFCAAALHRKVAFKLGDIALLNRHIASVAKSPEYREIIEKAGSIPVLSTPEELGKILIETYEQTARISREFGLVLD